MEQLHLVENLTKIIGDIRSENQNFSKIFAEIDCEKENLKNQNSLLKSMLLSYNPNITFTNDNDFTHKKTAKNTKNQNFLANNKVFYDMLSVIKNEFQKMNTQKLQDFQQYFEILEHEYQKILSSNSDLKTKQQEFLDFLTNVQESIEVKYKNIFNLFQNFRKKWAKMIIFQKK